MREIRLEAHAKVNLFLNVGPRRADGYHSLETVFQEISLHDKLIFRSRGELGIDLSCSDRKIPTGKDNLIVRALEMLSRKLTPRMGIAVELEKNIPVGAGLGGGSSDAAAALWGGYLLWKNLPTSRYRRGAEPQILKDCAKKLGADVTFFLKGGRALATGIGEKLTALPSFSSQPMVLVYPGVGVSTKDAYRWLDESRAGKKSLPDFPELNSFEKPVFAKVPPVKKAFEVLEKAGCRPVMMSGSGATVFGFVPHGLTIQKVRRRISDPRWKIFVAHT